MLHTALRPIFFALAAALLLGPSSAGAHTLPQERKVVAQVAGDRVEILVEFLEPPNDRVQLLLRRFDLDGDG